MIKSKKKIENVVNNNLEINLYKQAIKSLFLTEVAMKKHYATLEEIKKGKQMNKITIDKLPALVSKCIKDTNDVKKYGKIITKKYLNGTVTRATKIIVDEYSRTNLELAFTSLVDYLSYYDSKQYAEYYMILYSDKTAEREKLMTEIINCTIENGILVHTHSDDTKNIVDIVCDLKESRWALNHDELEVTIIKNTLLKEEGVSIKSGKSYG